MNDPSQARQDHHWRPTGRDASTFVYSEINVNIYF
jgi:hypothetical protein